MCVCVYPNKFKVFQEQNKVIETSGRLHPLWPQNKRLRTSWTTDWMHTRQDRWIQTELAFTLAKNATKPNPFKIVSLQPTRKENNWKKKETLARAVVTLETERIKGYNPWCLWWWWCSSKMRWCILHKQRSPTKFCDHFCHVTSTSFDVVHTVFIGWQKGKGKAIPV
jgi:hypothetical protein